MKTFFVLFVCIINITISFSQIDNVNVLDKILSLKTAPQLNYNEVLFLKIAELQDYGDGFVYYKNINEGNYKVEDGGDNIHLIILLNDKNRMVEKIIKFKKIQSNKNGIMYNDLEMLNEWKYIDYNKSIENIKKNIDSDPSNSLHFTNPIWKNLIIVDRQICNNLPNGPFWGKILSRGVTTQHLITFDNQPCELFADATDGVVFPYANGDRAKILMVDRLWNRLIFSDRDRSFPYASSFGSTGSGQNQFLNPFGIAKSEKFNAWSGVYEYDTYVADYSNNSIVYFKLRVYDAAGNTNIVDFVRFNNLEKPYDIEVHPGLEADNGFDDIVYFTQNLGRTKTLRFSNYAYNFSNPGYCLRFQYNGQIYGLNPTRISINKLFYSGNINGILACIDDNLNAVVFFKLWDDGRIYTSSPEAPAIPIGLFQFSANYKLTSVKVYSGNPALGISAVTTMIDAGYNGYLSLFKIHALNNTPVATEYLASTSIGRGSDLSFKGLNNLESQDGFLDIFTVENWSQDYGIRRFKPGIDLLYENASVYCRNTNSMTLDLKTTNPCRLDFSAKYYRSGGTLQDVQITSINGVIWQPGGVAFLPSGSNRLTIRAALPPPPENPAPDEGIRLTVRMVPQDENITVNNSILITRVYDKEIRTDCSSGGGCPYLYVDDGEGLKQDNNIFHKSEIPLFTATDITDKYKLRVLPYFRLEDNTCLLQFKELNDDYSYFDKVQLKAIDHPVGTQLGITENNDLVLYFPNYVNNPDGALLNDSDVTCSLQYDTNCVPVTGDSSDGLTVTGTGEKYRTAQKNLLRKQLNILKSLQYDKNKSKKAVRDDILLSDITDSLAIIFDPEHDIINPHNPAKNWAGELIAYDFNNDYNSGYRLFTRRENRSETIVPVGQNIFVDSVYTEWYRDFNITYFCNASIYYEGFAERNLELVYAEHSINGNVTSFLIENDDQYANMDNNATISMSFRNTDEIVPEGWVRDYVIIVDGRYDRIGDNMLQLNNFNNPNLPRVFKLHQNYPNPFNPKAIIKYDLPKDIQVSIKVYDILGREVKTLVNDFKKAGYYEVIFDGENYASGVYFYRIEAGTFVVSKKMVLIK